MIPEDQTVVFERYSDSAGSYVTLDPKNPAVYKQLYRAAKAKLKLRFKATIIYQGAEGSGTFFLSYPPPSLFGLLCLIANR